MNAQKMTSFLLFFGILALAVSSKVTSLTFPLHNSDEVCINIHNLLQGHQMLNDLSVTKPDGLEVKMPNAIDRQELQDFLPKEVVPGSVIEMATFGKQLAVMAKNEAGETIGVVLKYDSGKSQWVSRVRVLAPRQVNCRRISMNEEILSTACYSPLEKQGFYCSVRHKDDFNFDCSLGFSFDLDDTQKVLDGQLEMDAFDGRAKNRLFAFYYSDGKGAYDQVKNKYYLRDANKQKFISIEAGARILSISITSYDFDRKLTNLLIFAEDAAGRRTLRYYVLEDFIVKRQKDNSEYQVFPVDPTAIYFKDYSLFVAEKPDAQGLVIKKDNLKEQKFPRLIIKDQTAVQKIIGSRNLFVFQTVDAKQQLSWFFLDTFCDRFYRYEGFEPELATHPWTIMQVGYSSYIVVLKPKGAVLLQVSSFQSVCASFPNQQFQKGALEFSVNGQPVLSASMETRSFDTLLHADIISKQAALSIDADSERQFHLNLHGNDLDFSDRSSIYYFHRVQMGSAEERPEDVCVPLRVLIKNRNLINLCSDNRLVVYSSYSLDFKSRTFEFRFKSTYTFAELNLAEVVEVKLYYNQYLALISKQRRFTYIDLGAETASLPVVHSDELQQYERCVFSKHYIICQTGKYYVVLEVAKSNDLLSFHITNAFTLDNALIESVILSQFHQNTVYYIRESFHKKGEFHLIQEVDNVDRKLSRNKMRLSGKSSKVVELNKDEFVLIDWADGLKMRGMIGESFIHYPFKFESMFEDVISIKLVEEAKIFVVFYRTKDGKARVYMGRSSLMVYDRTIRDVEVGNYQDGMQIEAHFIVWTQVLISVYRQGDASVSHNFIYFINGPVYFVEKGATPSEIAFNVNGKEIHRLFAQNEPLPPLKVEANKINFRDPEGEQVVRDVEASGDLTITGGIRDFDSLPDSEDAKLLPRINKIESRNIRSSLKRGLEAHVPKNLASSFSDFSFFYGDLIFKKKEQKSNKLFKSCKFIDRGDLGSTASPMLLCRDKARNDNVITDMEGGPMYLNAPAFKFNAYNLIQQGDIRFFFAKTTGNKNLHFWRFKVRADRTYELEGRRVVTANDFYLGSMIVENFFTTAQLIPGKIVLLIHEAFSPKVTVKILDIETNVFEKYNFAEFPLLEAGSTEPRAIHEMHCADSKPKDQPAAVRCIIRSDQFLFDATVHHEADKGFSFKIHARYPFWRNEIITNGINVAASNNFIAIQTKAKVGNDIWIYRRPDTSAATPVLGHLFGSFKVTTREKIAKISISDADEASLKQNKMFKATDASLWVAAFSDPLQESDVYKHLTVTHYMLSNFKVVAKSDAASVNNQIELHVTDQSGAVHTTLVTVAIQHHFVLKVLFWVFILLLIAFFALCAAVIYTYGENKKIKNAILREGHNQSMFLDRTMMQI